MIERTLVWISGHSEEALHALLLQLELQYEIAGPSYWNTNLWISDSTYELPVKFNFHQTSPGLAGDLIGTERQLIVYDAFQRFDVDSFAAICGTLKHGGTLFLLSPEKTQWPSADRLEMQRFTVFGAAENENHSLYIHWFTQRLDAYTTKCVDDPTQRGVNAAQQVSVRKLRDRQLSDAALAVTDQFPAGNTASLQGSSGKQTTRPQPNDEQRNILLQWGNPIVESNSSGARVQVLTADRGRGKSALLGMLCAELIMQNQTCVVTAPNRRASEILIHHCKEHLKNFEQNPPAPAFRAPDDLLQNSPTNCVLLVDEAAALPLPVLKKLVTTFPRVILATTIHGYEGAGRGFSIRFRHWLEINVIPFAWKTLDLPVRWLPGDLLEEFCNDAFMLNAEYAVTHYETISIKNCSVNVYTAAELLKDHNTLRQCFALLVQAHYQTKPMDLRHILDGQNIHIYVLKYHSDIVGTALVAIESLADTADLQLKRAIVERRRRPRGHLLPQLLAHWTQDIAALELRIARIVRIAIHPQQQNRGLGSYFLQGLEQQLLESKPLDAMGAMFGEDERVNRYWQRNGYHNFHLGRRKNNRSGSRSLAVIKPLQQAVTLVDKARLLYSINSQATPLSAETGAEIRSSTTHLELDTLKDEIVGAYLSANRSFDDSRQFIIETIRERLTDNTQQVASLNDNERRLLSRATEITFEFTDCAKEFGFTGKKSAEIFFKTALEKLIT